MEISKQLSYIKKTYNLTQSDMAKLAGISQSTMSDWLNGKVNPTITNLISIANNLNITLDYLVGRENEDGTIVLMGNNLSKDEEKLIDKLRTFDDIDKNIIYNLAETIYNKNKNKF